MNKVLLLLGSFLLLADRFNEGCQFSVIFGSSVIPDLRFSVGRRQLKVSITNDHVFLGEGEQMEARCVTGFDKFKVPLNVISLSCEGGKIYVNSSSNYLEDTYLRGYLECNKPKWSLHEMETNRECHSPGSTTFVMSISNRQENNVLGTLCYDMESMIVKRLQYVLQAAPRKNMEVLQLPPMNITVTPDDMEIRNGFDKFKTASTVYVADGSQKNWLKLANYQSLSIVRLGYQSEYFNHYDPLMDIPWWPNLLYGNWQRYTDALAMHLYQVPEGYCVYAGIEGWVEVPQGTNYSQVRRPELLLTQKQRPIPLYVWNYLKANDNSEEIVIIGYNSPFFEFQPSDEAIFCQDICHDVAWLKNSTDTFRFTTMGVIFCCRPEDVLKSGKLTEFPTFALEADPEENPLSLSSELMLILGLPTQPSPAQPTRICG